MKPNFEKKVTNWGNYPVVKKEIKAETKVPLSYMGEYYDLIMHLELIISKINMKLASN